MDINTLNAEINRVIAELSTMEPNSKEYADATKTLGVLMQVKKTNSDLEKEEVIPPTPRFIDRLSPDVVVGAATNLIGILLVLNYEQLHVIGSKAFNWIVRSRV